MAKFENTEGQVIEVESESAINDYRAREGFTEVDESKSGKKSTSKSES